jgi:uncharacterized surface protein with fasciclin (FAS1) repeats
MQMKKYIFIPMLAVACFTVLTFSHCKKTTLKETTTSDVNILQYLQQDTAQRFTKLLTIIDRAGFTQPLNIYGTYTLFAPTNDAIDAYVKQLGKTSIDQLTTDQMKDMLKFHLLNEMVRTSDFNDGKLNSMTMLGQYLVTGLVNKDGVSTYTVNRQGAILNPNIVLGNGVVHVIDHVLTPSTSTLAQLVEQNPDYSIFIQALKETGYYDTLNSVKNNDGTARWMTLIAETNQALKDTGILSYGDLKKKYNNTSSPKNANDSLHLYVAYHILPDVKYLADIVMSGSHETLAPLEVLTDKMVNKKVLINDDSYNTITGTVYEKGVELDQTNSDVTATNGVLHQAKALLSIKVRNPFPVYWDLCATQPELTRLSSVYRKQTYLFDYGDGNTFKDIKWEKSCLKYRTGVTGYLGDYWQMGLGTSSSNTNNLGKCDANSWIEFTTPLLVKGKYKVWFCYYTQNSTVSSVQASFDSVPLTSALIQFNQKIASIDPTQEATLEALGWKWWAGVSKKSGSTAARMVGIVDVKVTGRHKIRFDLISGSNSDCNFDMIHFIPVNMNQTSPRFNPDGSIEY